jgi:hypothetical protein
MQKAISNNDRPLQLQGAIFLFGKFPAKCSANIG